MFALTYTLAMLPLCHHFMAAIYKKILKRLKVDLVGGK